MLFFFNKSVERLSCFQEARNWIRPRGPSRLGGGEIQSFPGAIFSFGKMLEKSKFSLVKLRTSPSSQCCGVEVERYVLILAKRHKLLVDTLTRCYTLSLSGSAGGKLEERRKRKHNLVDTSWWTHLGSQARLDSKGRKKRCGKTCLKQNPRSAAA